MKKGNRCHQVVTKLIEGGVKNPPKGKEAPVLLEVHWVDALGLGYDWESPKQVSAHRPEPTVSIGYVWEETEEYVILVSTLNTMHACHGILIPTGCIKWKRKLR